MNIKKILFLVLVSLNIIFISISYQQFNVRMHNIKQTLDLSQSRYMSDVIGVIGDEDGYIERELSLLYIMGTNYSYLLTSNRIYSNNMQEFIDNVDIIVDEIHELRRLNNYDGYDATQLKNKKEDKIINYATKFINEYHKHIEQFESNYIKWYFYLKK